MTRSASLALTAPMTSAAAAAAGGKKRKDLASTSTNSKLNSKVLTNIANTIKSEVEESTTSLTENEVNKKIFWYKVFKIKVNNI